VEGLAGGDLTGEAPSMGPMLTFVGVYLVLVLPSMTTERRSR
jgi:hypothetical protein